MEELKDPEPISYFPDDIFNNMDDITLLSEQLSLCKDSNNDERDQETISYSPDDIDNNMDDDTLLSEQLSVCQDSIDDERDQETISYSPDIDDVTLLSKQLSVCQDSINDEKDQETISYSPDIINNMNDDTLFSKQLSVCQNSINDEKDQETISYSPDIINNTDDATTLLSEQLSVRQNYINNEKGDELICYSPDDSVNHLDDITLLSEQLSKCQGSVNDEKDDELISYSPDDSVNHMDDVTLLSRELSECQDSINDQQLNKRLPSLDTKSSNFSTEHSVTQEVEQVPELQNLGVCAYDQTQFEKEVMDQVDKALQLEEEKLRKQEIERKLKSVADDIRLVHKRLGQLEKALSLAPKDANCMIPAGKREINMIKKEQENKLKHLKKLEAKQKMLNACSSGNTEDLECNPSTSNDAADSELDEETLFHLNQVFTPKETEEERLIRTGQMTPFGTVVSNKAKPKPKKIIIPQNQLTDFDKFLLNQAEEKQKKKPIKTPVKHPIKKKPLIIKGSGDPSTRKSLSSTSKHFGSEDSWRSKYFSTKYSRPSKRFNTTENSQPSTSNHFTAEGCQPSTSKRFNTEDCQPSTSKHFSTEDWQPSTSKHFNMEDCQPSTSSHFSADDCQPSTSKHLSTEESQPSELSKQLILPSMSKRKAKRSSKKIKLGTKYAEGMAMRRRKPSLVRNYASDDEISDFEVNNEDDDNVSDKDYNPDDHFSDSSDDFQEPEPDDVSSKRKKKNAKAKSSNNNKKSPSKRYQRVVDDGRHDLYIKRLKRYEKEELLKKHEKIMKSEDSIIDSDDEYTEFDDFKVPTRVWDKLYRYQQTGVRWLWELHQQNCGGIVGDEMGLGKTIQVIVFLTGLEISKQRTDGDVYRGRGPIVLVCPTTVMHQWVKEFHTWWPRARVAVLHESGSYVGKKANLVGTVNQARGILVTSYSGLVQHQLLLLQYDWHYIILDEGHKIRNPDAQVTLAAKQFRTAHRLILSGSPIQNNLKELWSLFDFIFPGKLGTLPVFMEQFSVPIVQGGYSNATQVQVQTAFKCATVLRDTIKPYLLRRMKADVKQSIQLPAKSEQVLFCKLSNNQKELYKAYLDSSEVQSIISARLQIFVGLINLRKICNHPDLYTGGPKIFKDTDLSTLTEDMHYGYYKRSGKMIVVDSLLRLWHKQGHRVLLFTQSRQMMVVLEIFVKNHNYTYMKMDGSTAISSRQPAIAKFNSDPSIFVFLLTTRVGGLGVNLTGANRVIIFDPDWNPSTDAQARERSWRIGQEKQVTIYRLLTAGTIEEKIYHRQIFKQFVTNRVLKDPRQRRFFKSNDLYELFTFSDMGKEGTETSAIFAGTGSEIKPVKLPKRNIKNYKSKDTESSRSMEIEVSFSSSKVQKMKELAKRLSSQLAKKQSDNSSGDASTEKQGLNSGTNNPPILSQRVQINSPKKKSSAKSDKNKVSDESTSDKNKISGENASDKNKISDESTSDKNEASEIKKGSKRKWRSTIVEGEEIKYLVKTDVYKTANEEQEENKQNDDYVLSKLFKKSGVHTALKHDAIVDASDPDYMLVEGEANKVAQEAIKALKQSRRQCARAVEGIPTWTGTNGNLKRRFGLKKRLPPSAALSSSQEAVVPEERDPGPSGILCNYFTSPHKGSQNGGESNSGVLSSSDLLAAIKKRKEMFRCVGNDDDNHDSDRDEVLPDEPGPQTEYDELLVDMRNFIAFGASVDGQATTDEVVRHFREKLPMEHTAVFRSLLTKISNFSRTSSGGGIWFLKQEFR